jgi:branched-chain amino acid transport system permease protein
MATLGLALATPQILKKYDGLTHGTQGINVRPEVPPTPAFIKDWFGISLTNDQWIYFLVLFIVFLMTILALNIVRSRIGRAFVAIRDSEIAAQAMGISVPRYKTVAFAISAFYAGVAGGAYVQVVGYVSPESFGFLMSINFLTTIVIGGLASILGSVLGAAGFVLVPSELPGLLSRIPGVNVGQELSWALYGGVLILVMIFAPYGLAGLLRRWARWVSTRPRAEVVYVAGSLVGAFVAGLLGGELLGAVVGKVIAVVSFSVGTCWVWAPPLRRAAAGGYSRSVQALRSPLGSPGGTEAGPEAPSSQDHPDAER